MGINLKDKINQDQIKIFSELLSFQECMLNSINLKEIRFFTLKFKMALVDLLQGVEGDDIERLKKDLERINETSWLKNVIEISKIYKNLNASTNKDSIHLHNVWPCCEALLKLGEVDLAIGIVNSFLITLQYELRIGFERISGFLAKLGQIDKAIKIARGAINPEDETGFMVVAKALIPVNINQALDLANKIPKEDVRGKVYVDICEQLLKLGCIDKAVEVAGSIPKENLRGYALINITTELLRRKEGLKARLIANSIPDQQYKNLVLRAMNIYNPLPMQSD